VNTVRTLRRFVRDTPAALRSARAHPRGESCELCRAVIGAAHDHVVDLDGRRLCCACRPCALLFEKAGAAHGRYRTVPRRVHHWVAGGEEEAALGSLQLPVGLAFFFFNSRLGRWVAHYPGPAGATESELPMDAWARLSEGNPLVGAAEPDVEAILVYAPRAGGPSECFLVPIDACYELTGALRRTWKGFDGGDEARSSIRAFFDGLKRRSRPMRTARPAGGSP
jgi:hypothetical protein